MKIKSLTTRISLVVTILTILVLLATIMTVYISSRRSLERNAQEETQYHLDLMVQSLSRVQGSVEAAAINSIPALYTHMRDTAAVMRLLQGIVKNNSFVSSAAVAYTPDFLPGQPYCMPIVSNYGTFSSRYAYKESNGDYIYNEWYLVPTAHKEPFWTDPYSNEVNIPVVSYAVPIRSEGGECEGVLALSIELSSFVNLLVYDRDEKVSIQNNVNNQRNQHILLDRNTEVLTAPHTDYIMNETLFTLAESLNDTVYSYMGHEIVKGRSGQEIITMGGEQTVATWRIIPKLQWTALVITPYSEVFASLKDLTVFTIGIALLAVLLSVIILIYSVRRSLLPLKKLRAATRLVGEGKYDTPLPDELLQRPDEIGELGREFVTMKDAVVNTVSQLEEERKHVKDNNRMLTMLVQNVVSNLQAPLADVLNFTDGLAVLAGNSAEAMVCKTQAEEGGKVVLQQFRQLNEMARLIATDEDGKSGMIVINSDEFMKSVMESVTQLEEKYFITIHKPQHDNRSIPIKTDTLLLETLIYQLVFEVSKTCNNPEVSFYSVLAPDENALRIVAEAATCSPIPVEEREAFFYQFANQKIALTTKGDTLQLYICYRMAEQLGAKLFVDSDYTSGNRFVLEIPRHQ